MFDPGLRIVEDPATGSAAGPLALHLARAGIVSFVNAQDSAVGWVKPSDTHHE
jgi:predicted PhzF superfamily epimerase YddE/YHI9